MSLARRRTGTEIDKPLPRGKHTPLGRHRAIREEGLIHPRQSTSPTDNAQHSRIVQEPRRLRTARAAAAAACFLLGDARGAGWEKRWGPLADGRGRAVRLRAPATQLPRRSPDNKHQNAYTRNCCGTTFAGEQRGRRGARAPLSKREAVSRQHFRTPSES